ncbi:Ig-like domain-containing protein [bacterium]|nr:Ig-like domain-containing protein [candidate division CSSED10-310 bacterium]
MKKRTTWILSWGVAVVLTIPGCSPENEGGFEDDYQTTFVSPSVIVQGLNYPWGVHFIENENADGTGSGSILSRGNILVANRGVDGQWCNSVVQVNPHSGSVALYTDPDRKDLHGTPATDGPMDIAFEGPFVWVANDSSGLGSVAVTDPNPSRSPNGPSGNPGDPVDGPTGTGVFGSDDFGFIVLDVFPEEDAEEVPQNTRIEVVFSQPVNPGTITADTFSVSVDYSPMSPDPDNPEGEFRFSPDFRRVEFIHEGYLAEATRYEIKLDKDISDYRGFELDGNLQSPGPDDFESLFTTGSGNPRVIWVNPPDQAGMVSIDTTVEVMFSEPVRASTVTTSSFFVLDLEGDEVDATVDVYPDTLKARLVFDEPLERNAAYTVRVLSKVADLSGNPLDQIPGGYPDPFESSFSTGMADDYPPYILAINPADGSQGVPADAVLTVTFSEDIAPSSRLGQYFTLEGPGGQISGLIEWPSDSELEFTPGSNLAENAVYTVTVSDILTDLVGNQLDGNRDGIPGGNFSSGFGTGWDRLYVTSSFPSDGDVTVSISTYVYVNFSKQVNGATVSKSTFYLTRESSPGNRIPASVWVNPGEMSATLKPDALLDEDTRHVITVMSDVADKAGNPLDQEPGPPLDPFRAVFTTGGEDRTPPCVVEIVPDTGAGNVPVSTFVTVRFSEPVLPATVSASSFILTGSQGQVTGVFGFENGNATVVFYPHQELIPTQTYTVILTALIADSSGNGLDGDCDGTTGPDFISTFTTGMGGIVINEVVVDPQQDWSDSEGGDGVSFNAMPGSGSITTSDEWIEITNASSQAFDLTGWSLEMIDTTPEIHFLGSGSGVEVVYPATSTLSNFQPGSYLVIGNPVGSNNNVIYFALKNAQGLMVDDVEIGDDPEGDGNGDGAPEPGEDGNADGIAGEAVARFPNAFDTDDDPGDFDKQAATIGGDNSGSSGTGPHAGPFRDEVGLVGMCGIAGAGYAPDEPGDMNYLCFVSHAQRGAVYGIDFDDGAYYAFTGIDAPTGLEFIPFADENGLNLPGRGYLFVLNPEKGNLARIRMMPSGDSGDPNTVSIPDMQGTDAQVYFTFQEMQDPVGIVYSKHYDRLYLACRGNGLIIEFTVDGAVTEIFDTGLGSHAIGGIDVGDLGSGEVVLLSHTGGERVDLGDGPQGALLYFSPHP